jgi:hypothetical protein
MVPDLEDYDRPAGLEMPGPLTPDPALPDLQQPDLSQETHMEGRPGDLAQNALRDLHDDQTYKQIPADDSQELWMQQHGDNQTRERHQGLLMLGLDREEHRK